MHAQFVRASSFGRRDVRSTDVGPASPCRGVIALGIYLLWRWRHKSIRLCRSSGSQDAQPLVEVEATAVSVDDLICHRLHAPVIVRAVEKGGHEDWPSRRAKTPRTGGASGFG